MLYRSFLGGLVAGVLIVSSHQVQASINYGDFGLIGGTALSVTESSATDPTPLFGPPTNVGNSLTFSTGPFTASQEGVGADNTAAQLSFVIQADPGLFIESISLEEIGDFLMLGDTAMVTAGGTLVATILDPFIGGFVSDPIVIDPVVPLTGTGSGIWSGLASVDITSYSATRVRIDLDNLLIASANAPADAAIIDKKALTVNVLFSENIPEPASAALMGMGLLAVLKRRR
jgi:PEP-CTERM motif